MPIWFAVQVRGRHPHTLKYLPAAEAQEVVRMGWKVDYAAIAAPTQAHEEVEEWIALQVCVFTQGRQPKAPRRRGKNSTSMQV